MSILLFADSYSPGHRKAAETQGPGNDAIPLRAQSRGQARLGKTATLLPLTCISSTLSITSPTQRANQGPRILDMDGSGPPIDDFWPVEAVEQEA